MPATAARKKHQYNKDQYKHPYDAPPRVPHAKGAAGVASPRRSTYQNKAQRVPAHRQQNNPQPEEYFDVVNPDTAFVEPGTHDDVDHEEDSTQVHRTRPRAAHARAVRRRARHVHRPFHLSLTVCVITVVLLAQLVALLWLKGLALEARDHSDDLSKKITETSAEIARTQDRVAELSSAPQLKRWAAELGLRPVTQADIDDVRQRTPLPPAASPNGRTSDATDAMGRRGDMR